MSSQETLSNQEKPGPNSGPSQKEAPPEKKPEAPPEKKPEAPPEKKPEAPPEKKPEAPPKKKLGRWLGRIPKEILISPGGFILFMIAFLAEVLDLIPLPLFDQIWELPLEIIFSLFFITITKLPWTNVLIPAIIERIPVLSDFLPTWLIRLFI